MCECLNKTVLYKLVLLISRGGKLPVSQTTTTVAGPATISATIRLNNCVSYSDDCHMSPQCQWRSLARSQLRAQQPRTQRASLGGRRPTAVTAALWVFPSRTRHSSTGPQPATPMVFNGQQIPQKCPSPWAKVHQRGKRSATTLLGLPSC